MGKVRERQVDLEEEILQKEAEKVTLKEEFDAKESEFSLTDNIIRQLEIDLKSKEKDMENRLLEIDYLAEEMKRLEETVQGIAGEESSIAQNIARQENEINSLNEKTSVIRAELDSEKEKEIRMRGYRRVVQGKYRRPGESLEDSRTRLFVTMSSLTETRNKIAEIDRLAKEKQKRMERQAAERRELEAALDSIDEKRAATPGKTADRDGGKRIPRRPGIFGPSRARCSGTGDRENERAHRAPAGEKQVKENFLNSSGDISGTRPTRSGRKTSSSTLSR